MIFVTIGSAVKGIEFTRLIERMDKVAKNIEEKVVMQIGTVPFEPRHASFFRYCSYQESLKYFERASLVVGHCGTGTILNAMRFQVPLILVPRRIRYGELNKDDHQVEIAQKVEGTPMIYVVYEIDDLEETVKKVLQGNTKMPGKPSFPEREKLIGSLREFLKTTDVMKS